MTHEESEMLETLRGLSEHRKVQFTATYESGVWECHLLSTPHPLFLKHNPSAAHLPPDFISAARGVGTSFVDAFNNLDGNDVEGPDDKVFTP
jgi:hypothetical protein